MALQPPFDPLNAVTAAAVRFLRSAGPIAVTAEDLREIAGRKYEITFQPTASGTVIVGVREAKLVQPAPAGLRAV